MLQLFCLDVDKGRTSITLLFGADIYPIIKAIRGNFKLK